MRRFVPILPFAVALAISAVHAEGPSTSRVLDVRVDATGGGDDLGIELVASGLEVGQSFYVKQVVEQELYAFTEPVFRTADGVVVPHERINDRFTVAEVPADTLTVRYRVRPGGRARHGHQGLVTPGWAGFDGRAVLQPKEIGAYGDVRWHFTLPDGWVVASSLEPAGAAAWRIPDMEPRYRASVLKSLCVGLGPFTEESRTLGETEFRVFTMSRWEDGPELADKAHGVFRFFHEELGYDPGRPFALVWTPPGEQWAPVWSGSGATATCYERPQKGFHNWELLGHRVAHPMNEYAPDGFELAEPADHWFMEGWATYIEREALKAAGVADESRWNALLERHHEELAAHPQWRDFPLRDELLARDDLTENLHYRRGALVAKMVAFHAEQRSGRSFEEFMRGVFKRHAGFEGGVDLRAELGAFVGKPMDDVWTALVDEAGPVIPVWEAYEQALPASRPGPVLSAGAVSWSAEQLHGMLRSGRFESAGGLAAALRDTGRMHGELERRGVRLLPEKLRGTLLAFPADVRADVDELERGWPLEGGPALPSQGCGGPPGPLPLPDLVASGAEGELFLRLVEAERAATWRTHGAEGLIDLRFGIDEWAPEAPNSAMALGSDEKLRVLMRWVAPHPGMRLEIWDGDERVAKRWVEVQSDWRSTWMRIGPDQVDDSHTGILEVRMVHDGKVVARRPFWRRATRNSGP